MITFPFGGFNFHSIKTTQGSKKQEIHFKLYLKFPESTWAWTQDLSFYFSPKLWQLKLYYVRLFSNKD